MAENNYIDLDAMRKRAEEERQQKENVFSNNMKAMTEQSRKEREAVQALWNKSLQMEHDKAEKKRAVEIEVEKAKAIAEVEAKYESQGVKSEKSKQRDAAWKSMLSNMRGMND
ncbi:hypothetical protein [Enterococcus thailandicus]|uniref:hypothetical protein n=1 Tax=Enterococcus thailandicus TaxID=417368 RepID=UPI0035DD0F04